MRVGLLRAAGGRLELLSAADLLYGFSTDGFMHRVFFDLAPGLRYWLNGHFALGTPAGLLGDLGVSSAGTITNLGFFTGLQVLGVL